MLSVRHLRSIILLFVLSSVLLIDYMSRWAGHYVNILQLADLVENPLNSKSNATSSRRNNVTTIIFSTNISGDNNHKTVASLTGDVQNLTNKSIPTSSSSNNTNDELDESLDTERCSSLNSPSWLQGGRVGNSQIPDEWLDHIMQPLQILNQPNLNVILGQTLCYPSGNFSKVFTETIDSAGWNVSDAAQVRHWEFRLLYLAIHRFMHAAAYPEYQARRHCSAMNHDSMNPPDNTLVSRNLSNFDYECPNSKFMVLTVDAGAGVGTTLRNGIVPSLFLALVTDRIPVLLQSVVREKDDKFPNHLSQTFFLASCPRRDWQCVFLPTTPCTLTMDDLRNALVVEGSALRDLRRRGGLPPDLSQARVLLLNVPLDPLLSSARIHDNIRTKMHQLIMKLLDEWERDQPPHSEELWKVLSRAAESFTVPYAATASSEENQSRKDRIFRAALLYLLRPNVKARQEVEYQLNMTLPQQSEGRQYFGLPIRGTDKCKFESTCHSFDKYMQLMRLQWQRYGSRGKRGTVLLTSEDPSVATFRHAYADNVSFPLDIVVNEMDRPQGHGAPSEFADADAVMIGSLAVLKLQMRANVLVLNCCSQFHSMLRDLVQEGCGADPELHWECLNEIDDVRFRICCGRTKQGICQQIWEDHRNDPVNIELMSETK